MLQCRKEAEHNTLLFEYTCVLYTTSFSYILSLLLQSIILVFFSWGFENGWECTACFFQEIYHRLAFSHFYSCNNKFFLQRVETASILAQCCVFFIHRLQWQKLHVNCRTLCRGHFPSQTYDACFRDGGDNFYLTV